MDVVPHGINDIVVRRNAYLMSNANVCDLVADISTDAKMIWRNLLIGDIHSCSSMFHFPFYLTNDGFF